MKLRNKKTGELVDAWSFYDGNKSVNLKYFTNDGQVNLEYRTLAELNGEWEDYTTPKPLIKDEKIRKAVRAWAEAGEIVYVYCNIEDRLESAHDGSKIVFSNNVFEGLPMGLNLTIAELCGEAE